MRKKLVVGGNYTVIGGDRCVKERSTLKCDATDRGDETRVAHACTLPVEAGWSLELPGDGRHGQDVQGSC